MLYNVLDLIWGKNASPKIGPKKVFSKYSVMWPLFTYRTLSSHKISKKILRVDSEKKEYKVLSPVLSKKRPILVPKVKYSLFLPLVTNNALSSCEISEISFMLITRTTGFCPNLDKKVPFWDQKEFFQIIHYCQICLNIVSYHCTKSKNKSVEVLGPMWDKNVSFRGQPEVFKIFTIAICVFLHCLIVLLNLKKFLGVDFKKKVSKSFRPKIK